MAVSSKSGTRGKDKILSTGDFQAPVETAKSEWPKIDVERIAVGHAWKAFTHRTGREGPRGKRFTVERATQVDRGKDRVPWTGRIPGKGF